MVVKTKLQKSAESSIARGKRVASSPGTNLIANATQKSEANKQIESLTKHKEEFFFPSREIIGERWNKLYPYQLLVVGADKSGNYTIIAGSKKHSVKTYYPAPHWVVQEGIQAGMICTLPITPQQLQIIDHFAISTSATMRGVIEEHSGVRFKTIVASGTTGIWPERPTLDGEIKTMHQISSRLPPSRTNTQSIFAGTIGAATEAQGAFKKVASAFTGSHPGGTNTEIPEPNGFASGYFYALEMQEFFEKYAIAKKRPENKHWRLALHIPKQNQTFLVTPQQFSLNQNHQRPNEILFSFQLKAWRRIKLGNIKVIKHDLLPKLDINAFQRIVNTLTMTRRALGASVNLIKAVRSDWRRSFDILRQTALAIKDFAGIPLAIIDVFSQLEGDFKSMVLNEFASIPSAFTSGLTVSKSKGVSSAIPSDDSGSDDETKFGIALVSIKSSSTNNEGLSARAISSGVLGADAVNVQQTDPINKVFENTEEYFGLFNEITLDSLPLNEQQQMAVENELEKTRLLTIDNFRSFRQELFHLYLDLSNSYGAGDEFYSELYDRPTPRTRAIPLTVEENEVLLSIMEAVQSLDTLLSTKAWDNMQTTNSSDYVENLAIDAGIEFIMPKGKILVPIPFGLTIEEIAARYLGDSDKWIEIVTLNGLRSPYIDEVGFEYSLLSNAEDRSLIIKKPDIDLFVGQKITLGSSTVQPFQRNITEINKVGEFSTLIVVDGIANLDNLLALDNAFMRGFLPGTINSQDRIYIPSNLTPTEEDQTFEISGLTNQHLTQISKVDWLLTDRGDLAINSVGDLRLASGLTNLIQAMKLKIKTRKGSLLRHINYGLGLSHGISLADIEGGELFNSLNEMIEDDPRFDFISRLNFILEGSTLAIDMVINLTNNNGVLPLNFEIQV